MNGIRWSFAILALVLMSGSTVFAGEKGNKGNKDPEKHWEKRFHKMDSNNDGEVTEAEFVAFKQAQAAKRHERKEKKADAAK